MKILATLPILLLTAACAHAVGIEQLGMLSARPDVQCGVEVSFGSACCGINRAAHDTISGVIAKRTDVRRAVEWSWGREGERTLCVVAASPAAGKAIFDDLSARRFPSTNHSATAVTRGDERVALD
ncbi:MAG: hypothetical protein JWP35_1816 [Caulobacter sp.]|nr:hypothetical protein [Caulobacter sp.]